MKYALDHLQQHFPKMKELNLTDREDTFKKIQDLSKEVQQLEEQHKLATQLLSSVNERVGTIWNRCDPHVKDLMQKQGLNQLNLSMKDPMQASMQMASWVDATRQCHVDKFECSKEKDECIISQKQATNDKDAAIKEKDKKQGEVENLRELKGECKDMPKIEKKLEECVTERTSCLVEKAKLEPKAKGWASTLSFGLF